MTRLLKVNTPGDKWWAFRLSRRCNELEKQVAAVRLVRAVRTKAANKEGARRV